MDSTSLYISNYVTEIKVPLCSVVDVSENRWLNCHPVTIHLRGDTPFGQRIMFMSQMGWRRWGWFLWGPHPVVRQIVAAAQENGAKLAPRA
jgi:hypothetical protein